MKKLHFTILSAAMIFSLVTSSYAQADLSGKSAAYISDGDFEIRSSDENIFTGAPLYTFDGESVNMKICGKNTGSEKGITAVLAAYSKDNMLLGITYDKKNVLGDFELSASLALGANAQSAVLKTFLVDDISAGVIYTDNFDTSRAGGMNFSDYGWKFNDNAKISSEEKYSGLSSLKLESGSANTMINAESNSIYKLSFYAKGGEVTYGGENSEKTSDACDEWSVRTTAFETDDDGKASIMFKGGNENAFIDNLSIDKNLITNPGFENGSEAYENSGENSVSDNFLDGEKAILLNGGISQNVSVVSGVYYTLKYYSKGGETTLSVKDKNENIIAEKTFEASDSYRFNHLEFFAPDSEIIFEITTSSESVIDCLNLEKSDNNIIINSLCDYDVTTLWDIQSANSNTRLSVTEGVDGKNGLMLTGRGRGWIGIRQYIGDEINKYGRGLYTISGYAKFPSGTNKLEFYIIFRGIDNDNTTQNIFYIPFEGIGEDWTYFEKEIRISSFGKDENGNLITDKCIVSPNSGYIRACTPTAVGDDFAICDLKITPTFDRISQ